ncbi:MAG: OmpH family outer membrane protein, partial [Anaerolineales bacterium]|nr:OmpH family outer membrane protein [Anaerolineales bacterium]
YEQYCNYDLDGDGYAEPYIMTVHAQSQKVVRIVARWNAEGLILKLDDSILTLKDLRERVAQSRRGEFETDQMYIARLADTLEEDIKRAKLVKIEPMKMLTKYGFIDSADGCFLDYGFVHIMIGAIKGINIASNALFNSGDLSNLQGGLLSKEHRRKKRGNMVIKPGQWNQTEVDALALQNSIVNFPTKEPSQTLLALTEQLKQETRQMSTRTDLEQLSSPNIPAASVLGIMQEGVIPTTALISNVVDSMTAEFQIMHELNKTYIDPEMYIMVNGPEASYENDYGLDITIKPTANSKFSSQFQKIQLAQVQMEQIPLVLQAGGNAVPILKNYFDAIGSDLTEQIFSQEISAEEQAMNERMAALQEQQVQQLREQKELLQAQVQIQQQDQNRKDAETQAKIETMQMEQARKDQELINDMEKASFEVRESVGKYIKDVAEANKLDAETVKTLSEGLEKELSGMSKIITATNKNGA